MESTNRASFSHHVVVLDYPFTSHSLANHTLARLLATAAPNVCFSFLGTAKSNASIASIPALPNLTLYAVSDSINGEVASSCLYDEANVFLKAAPGNLMVGIERAVKGGAGGVKVTCIVTDSFMAKYASKMAEEMGVPWIALRTGSACSLSVYVHSDVIRRNVGVGDHVLQEQPNKTLDFIPTLSTMRVRDLPEGLVHGDVNHPIPTLLREMGCELAAATAVAVNTFEALELDIISNLNTMLKKTLPIGPLNFLTLPTPPSLDSFNCLPWLDRQAPASVAYISFGTAACPTNVELENLALGLEASGVPFLWSLKEKFLVHLPDGFLSRTADRGMVVSWAPQMDILNHIATVVFVTHCGWKSVIESITAGVPMICRPICFDQKMNAKQVANLWEVGIIIDEERMTKEAVVNSLKSVLATDRGGVTREKVRVLKELAMDAVGPNGTSSESLRTIIDIICA